MPNSPLRHRWLLLKCNLCCILHITATFAPVIAMAAGLLQLREQYPILAELMPAWFLQGSVIIHLSIGVLAIAGFFLYTVSKQSPFRRSPAQKD